MSYNFPSWDLRLHLSGPKARNFILYHATFHYYDPVLISSLPFFFLLRISSYLFFDFHGLGNNGVW